MLRGWFTLAYQPERQAKWDEIRKFLMERSNPSVQVGALEQLVLLSYTETIPPHLLMPVIQYTATTHNHRVIKLLLMFLENCDTRDAMGQMRPEFILIGDALRNFLLHPNEYVRGAVLRFLYKVNDLELLHLVMAPILANLEYKDEYVRRHAAILVGRLARDLPDLTKTVSDSIIEAFSTETDQRTLTAMLYSAYAANPREAANFTVNMKTFYSTDMKLALLRVAPRCYRNFNQFRVQLLEKVVDFCEDDNSSVRMQAASVLRKLSNSAAALRTTATAYCELLSELSDENLRAFIVQELIDMVEEHPRALAPFALEIAHGARVSGPLHARLLGDVVQLVLFEHAVALVPIIATKEKCDLEALRVLLARFPAVAAVIADQVSLFATDTKLTVAEPASLLLLDCGVAGARAEAFRGFRAVLDVSPHSTPLARALWALSEFADDPALAVGILGGYARPSESPALASAVTVVGSDGSYATRKTVVADRNLRALLAEGNEFLALALVAALVRLKLRGAEVPDLEQVIRAVLGFAAVEKNARDVCGLWLSASGSSDIRDRLAGAAAGAFEAYRRIVEESAKREKTEKGVSAAAPLSFGLLQRAPEVVHARPAPTAELPVCQLTGPSDSLYIEAECTLRKFDRVYRFTVWNRTKATLTNILFEFTTIGAVSLLQRHDPLSLAAGASGRLELTVIISAGSCGTLFGAVSFDFAGAGGSDHQLLPLTPIEIDPFFSFEPATIAQQEFREKWAVSMWERRIDVEAQDGDLLMYVDRIATRFKFFIVTPREQLEVTARHARFVAANLFTRSLFGEEVELNVSAKLLSNGKITSVLRIRSPDEQLAYLFGKLVQ
jgi:coatomer subunit beta